MHSDNSGTGQNHGNTYFIEYADPRPPQGIEMIYIVGLQHLSCHIVGLDRSVIAFEGNGNGFEKG